MLTPVDIQNKRFSSGAMGYKKNEVEEFLELLLRDYETLYKSNIDLNDKINMLNSALEHYKAIEETMQNALLVAQSTGDDMRKSADEKARLIIEDAQQKANRIMEEASRATSDAVKEAESIKHSTELFKARMIGAFSSQIEMLKSGVVSEEE